MERCGRCGRLLPDRPAPIHSIRNGRPRGGRPAVAIGPGSTSSPLGCDGRPCGALGPKAEQRKQFGQFDQSLGLPSLYSEFFESIRPATTMVEVAKLIDDQALVEIEADAVIHREVGERTA